MIGKFIKTYYMLILYSVQTLVAGYLALVIFDEYQSSTQALILCCTLLLMGWTGLMNFEVPRDDEIIEGDLDKP